MRLKLTISKEIQLNSNKATQLLKKINILFAGQEI
jgi:hypothetical protein